MTIEAPIADLGLRPSVVAALAKDGIVCVGDLTVLTEPELRRVPHIGPKSLADIKAILDGMGLRLHDPELDDEHREMMRACSTRDEAMAKIAELFPHAGEGGRTIAFRWLWRFAWLDAALTVLSSAHVEP